MKRLNKYKDVPFSFLDFLEQVTLSTDFSFKSVQIALIYQLHPVIARSVATRQSKSLQGVGLLRFARNDEAHQCNWPHPLNYKEK